MPVIEPMGEVQPPLPPSVVIESREHIILNRWFTFRTDGVMQYADDGEFRFIDESPPRDLRRVVIVDVAMRDIPETGWQTRDFSIRLYLPLVGQTAMTDVERASNKAEFLRRMNIGLTSALYHHILGGQISVLTNLDGITRLSYSYLNRAGGRQHDFYTLGDLPQNRIPTRERINNILTALFLRLGVYVDFEGSLQGRGSDNAELAHMYNNVVDSGIFLHDGIFHDEPPARGFADGTILYHRNATTWIRMNIDIDGSRWETIPNPFRSIAHLKFARPTTTDDTMIQHRSIVVHRAAENIRINAVITEGPVQVDPSVGRLFFSESRPVDRIGELEKRIAELEKRMSIFLPNKSTENEEVRKLEI